MVKIKTVREVVGQVVSTSSAEREKAIALHDYVRENVKFGFNKYLDEDQSDYTLTYGYGHCNSQSRLMVNLFRSIGLEAYQHFVVIPKDILNGSIPPSRSWLLPKELCHSYVDVKVEGKWSAIDSFIIDTPLLKAAQAILVKERRPLGYGVRVDSINVWDGTSDAFSQFDQSMMIEDHGRIEELEVYFRTSKYRHKILGLRFNTIFRLMGERGMAAGITHLEGIRKSFTI
jgi:hypothetical protein